MARTNNQNRSQIGHWEGPKAPPDHRICFICPPSVVRTSKICQKRGCDDIFLVPYDAGDGERR